MMVALSVMRLAMALDLGPMIRSLAARGSKGGEDGRKKERRPCQVVQLTCGWWLVGSEGSGTWLAKASRQFRVRRGGVVEEYWRPLVPPFV